MHDLNEGVVRATPIVAAIAADVTATLKGLTLNDLFYAVSTAYVCLQFTLVVFKEIREAKARKEKPNG
ncbi:hypothetical protein DKDFKPND_00005 [Pseudomonas phage phi 21A]|nr:hypothetical protein DKDFKPND_00005 [Pseudomonas phage phi 21A]